MESRNRTVQRGICGEDQRVVALVLAGGEVFVPFVKLKEHAANYLTNPALDPTSRIPEYKVCAVRVEKLDASAESEHDASPAARGR
jgi:predicted molibdopterin-dependent oxidoreductase YjgC